MHKQNIRVRFAPSPTGPLHIGGIRTALFNYLFAKKHNGAFILRIEDTDRDRFIEGAESYIVEALNWCGIEIDEGVTKEGPFAPYHQSERKDIYKKYINQLIDKGWGYMAFDTPAELDNIRKEHEQQKQTFVYNAANREKLNNSLALPEDTVKQLINENKPYVIRFKMPPDETVVFNDIVRGEVKVNTSALDDKILFKSDGLPTYHLANVVDDHLMQISHVIRGEEWLPSTPLHVLLYLCFGWQENMPEFAHMPLTLKPTGKGKLSKRDGEKFGFPVFPIQWTDPKTGEKLSGFRESGYFPEAFINILAFLGWNPGTEQERFSMQELIQAFSLDKVGKAGARFDPEKARWFNHQYLVKKDDKQLLEPLKKILKEKGIQTTDEYTLKVIGLVKERADFISELWEQASFFFIQPTQYDPKALKKQWKNDTPVILQELINMLEAKWNPANMDEEEKKVSFKNIVKQLADEKALGMGKIMSPLRIALVGSSSGPDLDAIVALLGKEETIKRIQNAAAVIGG